MRCQVLGTVVDELLGRAGTVALHPGDHARSADLVVFQASLGTAHVGESLQATFNLAQSHTPALDLDQVILPTAKGQPAISIETADVPGSQPAVAVTTTDGYLAAARAQPDRRDEGR